MDIGSEVRVIDVDEPVLEPVSKAYEIEVDPVAVEEQAHDTGAADPRPA